MDRGRLVVLIVQGNKIRSQTAGFKPSFTIYELYDSEQIA